MPSARARAADRGSRSTVVTPWRAASRTARNAIGSGDAFQLKPRMRASMPISSNPAREISPIRRGPEPVAAVHHVGADHGERGRRSQHAAEGADGAHVADEIAVNEREEREDPHARVVGLRIVGGAAADDGDPALHVLDERLDERLVADVPPPAGARTTWCSPSSRGPATPRRVRSSRSAAASSAGERSGRDIRCRRSPTQLTIANPPRDVGRTMRAPAGGHDTHLE